MARIMDPDEFAAVVAEVTGELERLRDTYASAYGSAYARSRFGFTGAPPTGGHGDPTGDAAVSGVRAKRRDGPLGPDDERGDTRTPRSAIRGSLRMAGEHVHRALESIEKADAGLTRSLRPVDPPPSPNLERTEQYRQSRDEHAAALAAQRRRRERGEMPV